MAAFRVSSRAWMVTVGFGLCCAVACGGSSSVMPPPPSQSDVDDAGGLGDASQVGSGRIDDASTSDGAPGDSGGAPDGDAAPSDAAPSDAAVDAEDASTDSDAGEADAGASCGVDTPLLGNSCPGVVTCQDPSLSNDYIEACPITGASKRHCCVGVTNANPCRLSGCLPTEAEAACDGPEDCTGGNECCINASDAVASTSCQSSCGNADRLLCHVDQDCPAKHHCAAGHDVTVGPTKIRALEWWGFCESD